MNHENIDPERALLGRAVQRPRRTTTSREQALRVLAAAGIDPEGLPRPAAAPIDEPVIPPAIDRLPLLLRDEVCVFCGSSAEGGICDDCDEKNSRNNVEIAGQEQERIRAARLERFRIAVGDYADTDPEQLPDTAARKAARQYVIGGRRGLTIFGPGRTGKTRSAVWIGRREHDAGKWVEFHQCAELRLAISEFNRKGEVGISTRPLFACDVLILDDFGNNEFDRKAEEFFLNLTEHRVNHGRRTIVTTQYNGTQLTALFKTRQMADAILRRIGREYCMTADTKTGEVIL